MYCTPSESVPIVLSATGQGDIDDDADGIWICETVDATEELVIVVTIGMGVVVATVDGRGVVVLSN